MTGHAPRWILRASPQSGGEKTGKNSTDRGKPGTKRHLVVEAKGIPLAVTMSAANVHDIRMLEETVDAIEPIKGMRGRPRKRPTKLHADKAYDSREKRQALRSRGITPGIVHANLNEISTALNYYQQALTITREVGDKRNEGYWLYMLGVAYSSLNETKRAIEILEASLTLFEEIESPEADMVRGELEKLK